MEEKERYEVRRLNYSLNVKLTDNYEPDWRYIIFDDVNDKELAKLETVCDWLNQKDRRIKKLEQQLTKDFTLGEYIRLEQESQQLKQQLHDLPKKIIEEIRNGFNEKIKDNGFNSSYGIDLFWFNNFLETILKKYGEQ